MKLPLLTLLMIGMGCSAQTKPLDWKPCTSVTDTFKAAVDKFNAEHHDGFSIEASCRYSGDPGRKVQPELQVALTPAEIDRLHVLRRNEYAGFDAMTKYENELFFAHGIRKPAVDEPCYFFAGIIMDTDYITVDPNPMMATDDCTVNWKIRPKPAKPSAKKAAPIDLTKIEPVIKFCSGLTGECKVSPGAAEYTGRTLCDGCITVPNPSPSLPLDVPAIRKTVKDEPNCSRSYISGSINSGWTHPGAGDFPTYCTNEPTFHEEWHCPDDDAYSLQVSVNGKNARCVRIMP